MKAAQAAESEQQRRKEVSICQSKETFTFA
jgi:hypothetical protein